MALHITVLENAHYSQDNTSFGKDRSHPGPVMTQAVADPGSLLDLYMISIGICYWIDPVDKEDNAHISKRSSKINMTPFHSS